MFKTIFVAIVSGMTLFHLLKNMRHYSGKNKLMLPIIYTLSLVLMWHLSPLFFAVTAMKAFFFRDHVSQSKFEYYKIKGAALHIVIHDALAFLGALVASRL